MQVEFVLGARVGNVKSVEERIAGRQAESAQTRGNQRRRSPLKTLNQKVAPTQVYGATGGRIPLFLRSTQNDVPRMATCGLKLTSTSTTVKIGTELIGTELRDSSG